MIAITFAMELTVLRVSLYWQSSLVLACGRFLFFLERCLEQELSCRGGAAEAGPARGCCARSRRCGGSSRGAPVGVRHPPWGTPKSCPDAVQQHPPETLRGSAVGARRTCLRGFWARAGLGSRAGDRLMLSWLLLLGTFSWPSPLAQGGPAALLSCHPPPLPQSLRGHVRRGKDL